MAYRNIRRTESAMHAQTQLPLTLIPIRIEVDVPAHQPQNPMLLPADHHERGINPLAPMYKRPDPLPPFKLRDIFLWNLHEYLITPDEFAGTIVRDLDLPNVAALTMEISKQIRQQLEEYAGVALHPLFHSNPIKQGNAVPSAAVLGSITRDGSSTPLPGSSTPLTNGLATRTNGTVTPLNGLNGVTATATPIPESAQDENDPDDMYRCIISLSVNLMNKLYTDKFEWSLLHPPGFAERFAKQTCADLGLPGEWVNAMTHAIYEAVLSLKKDACESGGLIGGNGYGGEIDNSAIEGSEAGWRYDHDRLCDEWEPKVETLSKDDIERREGDRERQIRRQRRETARFSSTANMSGGTPQQQQQGGYFDNPETSETPMGRGERSKKKRRFRSLSPLARGGTPGGRGTPDIAGYGGGSALNDA